MRETVGELYEIELTTELVGEFDRSAKLRTGQPTPTSSHSQRGAGFGVEQLPMPEWVWAPDRHLDEPWFVVDIPEFVEDARKTSPPAFVNHGVYVNASELESV